MEKNIKKSTETDYPSPLIPVAYLKDNLADQIRVVAQISGTNKYVLLTPPNNFNIDKKTKRGDWVMSSAIGKYFFVPFDSPQPPITNPAAMKKFAEKLLKQKEE